MTHKPVSEDELQLEAVLKWLSDNPPACGSALWKPTSTHTDTPSIDQHLLNWCYNEIQLERVKNRKLINAYRERREELQTARAELERLKGEVLEANVDVMRTILDSLATIQERTVKITNIISGQEKRG